jgi:hypothetical protein
VARDRGRRAESRHLTTGNYSGEGGIRTREKSGLGSSSDVLGTTQRSRVVPSARVADGIGHSVETSQAHAIERASAAGEWGLVAQLAIELQARRVAVAEVLSLDGERARRSGSR